VDLAIRLHEFGLLPEDYRRVFVETVTSYALEGEDLHALESLEIQSVFTPVELSQFRTRLRADLLPKLAEVRGKWEDKRNVEQPADEHMQALLDSFSALKQEFADEPEVLGDIEREIAQVHLWISEHMANDSKKDRPARSFGDVDASDRPPGQSRGIFDDVDG
jgi:hypothetical protein